MIVRTFREKELFCEEHFAGLRPVFHICSPENFEIIFTCEEEFTAGMNIVGICCKLFPKIRVYTFQLMSNHFHIIAGGPEAELMEFVRMLKLRLRKYIQSRGRSSSIASADVKMFPINDLEYLRSAIAYVNRNGFVVNDDYSPYSYPWGANICYFNKPLKKCYEKFRQNVTTTILRALLHSKIGDSIKDLYILDNCISPFSFCDIRAGELAFRDEKNYFYYVSKNVESYGKIAKEIGEMLAYSDDDLYLIAAKYAREKCGVNTPSLLNNDAKMTLARKLRFEYNAGEKQLHRILKLKFGQE